ncbi:Molybdopterin synthase catalytic subunit [Azospirillaceae bacterium]
MAIYVQSEDFDLSAELKQLTANTASTIGAVVSFVGLVRDIIGETSLTALELEHYPGMTERQLAAIEAEAHQRWSPIKTLIIHRYGRLHPGDQIVLTIVASTHRATAFDACRFLIDRLKTDAPFWKQEETTQGTHWVASREEDNQASARWKNKTSTNLE